MESQQTFLKGEISRLKITPTTIRPKIISELDDYWSKEWTTKSVSNPAKVYVRGLT